jgi:DNA-binding HxlR family transcriptional regulator
MSTRRSYQDGCAGAHGLDLVGERWALLVVRELVLGPKRFTDLRAGLPGISPNVLTQRLGELERHSVLRRRKLAPPAGAWVYELTDWGRGLELIIVELGRWAARSPSLPRDHPLSVDSLILSFRTMFDPAKADGLALQIELHFGDDRFRAAVLDGALHIERGIAPQPEAVLTSNPNTLAMLAYDGADLAAALRAGELTVSGDKKVAKRFLSLFTLPAQAPANPAAG